MTNLSTDNRSIRHTFLLAPVILWLVWPWEWSLVDDTSLVLEVQRAINTHGVFQGILFRWHEMMGDDHNWGLFRPGWWTLASTIYALPVYIAYTLRMLMVMGAVYFPLTTISSRELRVWFLAILLCNRPMYLGLVHISLQEIPGMFFSGLGLSLFVKAKSTRSILLSLLCILFAGWFKAPFLWILLLISAYLLFTKRTALSLVAATTALTNLVIVVLWAKQGSYTSRITELQWSNILVSLGQFFRPASYTAVALGLLVISVGKEQVLKNLKQNMIFLIYALGGGIYFLNLLPWAAHGYYFGPPLYLIAVGVAGHILTTIDSDSVEIRSSRFKVLTFLLALFVAMKGMFQVYYKNADVVTLRDWALTIPQERVTLGINGSEAASKFSLLMSLRTNGKWRNTVVPLMESDTTPKPDYYIVFDDQGFQSQFCNYTLIELIHAKICRP